MHIKEFLYDLTYKIPDQPEIIDQRTILVASLSKIKINPVQGWHDKEFGNGTFKVEGIDVPSEVSNQPIGWFETVEGGLNRLKNAIVRRKGVFGYVSLESGLIMSSLSEPEYWEDRVFMCGVIGGQKFYGVSRGVIVPPYFVNLIEKAGKSITWGELEYTSQLRAGADSRLLNPQDPHKTITDGKYSRTDQLDEHIDFMLRDLIPIVYHPALRKRELV